MKRKQFESTRNILVFLISLFLLTLGFYRNEWAAAGRKWFYDWKAYQDVMVIGRLAESRQNGIFSHSGFIGIGDGNSWLDIGNGLAQHQTNVYLKNGVFQKYASYTTESAGYGFLFGLIDEFTSFPPSSNLKLFRFMVSALSAAALALFITWVYVEFNIIAAGSVLLFSVLSEWFALFGGSLYWNIWAYYLPFLCVLFYLFNSSRNKNYSDNKIFWIIFFSVFISELTRGFVFVTTTLIMLTVPVVYYTVKEDWGGAVFIKRMLSIMMSATTSTLLALFVLTTQITLVKGSVAAAFSHIQDTLMKRSIANADQFSGTMADSLRANRIDVIYTYLEGRAVNLNSVFHTGVSWFEISYLSIFIGFAIISLMYFSITYFREHRLFHDKKALALIISTWFSVLAPMSWLVIFTAHSYIHTQIICILWQMPFTLYGFAMAGAVITHFLFHN